MISLVELVQRKSTTTTATITTLVSPMTVHSINIRVKSPIRPAEVGGAQQKLREPTPCSVDWIERLSLPQWPVFFLQFVAPSKQITTTSGTHTIGWMVASFSNLKPSISARSRKRCPGLNDKMHFSEQLFIPRKNSSIDVVSLRVLFDSFDWLMPKRERAMGFYPSPKNGNRTECKEKQDKEGFGKCVLYYGRGDAGMGVNTTDSSNAIVRSTYMVCLELGQSCSLREIYNEMPKRIPLLWGSCSHIAQEGKL